MKQIDGLFIYELPPGTENHYLESLCPPGGSLCFFIPDRYTNYHALWGACLADTKKAAYVPIYIYETVLAPFLKTGYELLFYDVPKDLTLTSNGRAPDRISVVNLCGYCGFCSYGREFIRKCSERGIIIVEDTTHSLFLSGGVDPHCDYVVGSMRKWIGVPIGGFAIKRKDNFSLPILPPDETHPSMHGISMRGKQQLFQSGTPDPQVIQKFNDTFWDAKMVLRCTFDPYGSDQDSEYIIWYYDFEQPKQRCHTSHQYLLDYMSEHPQLTVIFLILKKGTVPSHLIVYVQDRDIVQSYLTGRSIKTATYWPQGPMTDTESHSDAAYTYSHVPSFTYDQRYETEDMEYICRQIEDISERQELGNKFLKIISKSGNTGM